jgi:hypothetical protein
MDGLYATEPHVSGGTVIAPGASVTSTSMQRAIAVTLDLLLAVALVLAVPLAFAGIAALVKLLIKTVYAAAVR